MTEFVTKSGIYTLYEADLDYGHYIGPIEIYLHEGTTPPDNLLWSKPEDVAGKVAVQDTTNLTSWAYIDDISIIPRWDYFGNEVEYTHPTMDISQFTDIDPPSIPEGRFIRFDEETQTWKDYAKLSAYQVWLKVGGLMESIPSDKMVYPDTYTKQPPSEAQLREVEDSEGKILIYGEDRIWRVKYNCEETSVYFKHDATTVRMEEHFTEDELPDIVTLQEPFSNANTQYPLWDYSNECWGVCMKQYLRGRFLKLIEDTNQMVTQPDFYLTDRVITPEEVEEVKAYRLQINQNLRRLDELVINNQVIDDLEIDTPDCLVDFYVEMYNRTLVYEKPMPTKNWSRRIAELKEEGIINEDI